MPLYVTTISGTMYEVAEARTVGDVLEMMALAHTAPGVTVINVRAIQTDLKHHDMAGVVLVHRIEGVFNA